MRYYVTFSGKPYECPTREIINAAGPLGGVSQVLVYDDLWLTRTSFFRHNKWLWDHHGDQKDVKRGFGWFAWKSYIILDALDRMQDGDTLLYTDADTYPISDFRMLFEECRGQGGRMVFGACGWERCNQIWCKRDCFIVMGQDEPRYHNADHCAARFMLFEKGPWLNRQFLYEWLTYCVNPLATTFDPSVLGKPDLDSLDPPEKFREHRTEQAIFTNLVSKYGWRKYREACQFGNGSELDRHLFGQLFMQVPASEPNAGRRAEGSVYGNVPARND